MEKQKAKAEEKGEPLTCEQPEASVPLEKAVGLRAWTNHGVGLKESRGFHLASNHKNPFYILWHN